jgi:hypothetical protein
MGFRLAIALRFLLSLLGDPPLEALIHVQPAPPRSQRLLGPVFSFLGRQDQRVASAGRPVRPAPAQTATPVPSKRYFWTLPLLSMTLLFPQKKIYDKAMKTTAFAYLRVSGRGQVDGDGFPRQRLSIAAYAKTHDITIKHWFEEKAISGAKDLEDRPELSALMVALHANGTKLVLIEKLDRLARDLMVQESIIADLRRGGFEIISVAEPDLCSDDPSRKLMRQMMGAFAEYEKSMIVANGNARRQRLDAAKDASLMVLLQQRRQ